MQRDAAEFTEASQEPDFAGLDTLDDHIAEVMDELWPSKWPKEIRPQVEKFAAKVIKAVLQRGAADMPDVQRIEGRDLLAFLVAEIIDAPNARLMARCVDFVFELGVQLGLSETQIAELEGCTKATPSLYCCRLKDQYRKGMPARGMKSPLAVENYRQLRQGRSSRGPRVEWQFAETLKAAYERPI